MKKLISLVFAFLIFTEISVIATMSFSSSDTPWSDGKSMPSKRLEVSAVALDNKVYIIGGMDDKGSTNLVEVYDPLINKWSRLSPLPEKLDHAGASTFDGKIYVVGGFNSSGISTGFLFIYDPVTDKWDRGKNMPTARGALTVKFVNGIMYAIGGDATRLYDLNKVYNPQGVVSINEAYDPKSDSWKTKSSMPTPRDHLSSAVIDGKIYVIGGRQPDIGPLFKDLNANEMYDPASGKWTVLKSIPTNRSGLAAATVGDKIYVIGGESTKRTYGTNEIYDSSSDSWISEALMPSPRHGLALVNVGTNLYAIAGGPKPGGGGSNINEIFHLK